MPPSSSERVDELAHELDPSRLLELAEHHLVDDRAHLASPGTTALATV